MQGSAPIGREGTDPAGAGAVQPLAVTPPARPEGVVMAGRPRLRRLRLIRSEAGATLAEYAVILLAVALVVVAGATMVGECVEGLYNAAIGASPHG